MHVGPFPMPQGTIGPVTSIIVCADAKPAKRAVNIKMRIKYFKIDMIFLKIYKLVPKASTSNIIITKNPKIPLPAMLQKLPHFLLAYMIKPIPAPIVNSGNIINPMSSPSGRPRYCQNIEIKEAKTAPAKVAIIVLKNTVNSASKEIFGCIFWVDFIRVNWNQFV